MHLQRDSSRTQLHHAECVPVFMYLTLRVCCVYFALCVLYIVGCTK